MRFFMFIKFVMDGASLHARKKCSIYSKNLERQA